MLETNKAGGVLNPGKLRSTEAQLPPPRVLRPPLLASLHLPFLGKLANPTPTCSNSSATRCSGTQRQLRLFRHSVLASAWRSRTTRSKAIISLKYSKSPSTIEPLLDTPPVHGQQPPSWIGTNPRKVEERTQVCNPNVSTTLLAFTSFRKTKAKWRPERNNSPTLLGRLSKPAPISMQSHGRRNFEGTITSGYDVAFKVVIDSKLGYRLVWSSNCDIMLAPSGAR